MNTPAAPPQEEPLRLSYSAVLGLSGESDSEWAKLRGMQYAALSSVTFFRVYAHAILAVFVAQIFMAYVPTALLAVWMIALAAVHIAGARFDSTLADVDRRKITRSEFHRQAVTSLISGLLWGSAALLFGPMGSMLSLMALVLIIAIIASGAIYFRTSPPLGAVLFTTASGLLVMAHLAISGLWFAVAAYGVFTVTTVLGALQAGQTYLEGRLSKNAIAEKEEVVSLLLREFEENEADWLWEIDPNRKLRRVSPRFAYALGGAQSDFEGKPFIDCITSQSWSEGSYPDTLHEFANKLKDRVSFSTTLVEVLIKDDTRWWELSGTPMLDERGRFVGFRGVGSDVTERRESDEKIAYLARFDTLTSLPNRLQLTEALGDALRYAAQWRTRCALLMVDLDRFKAVNDSLGHMTGDKLLAQVSSRLQALMGSNAICGRLGGDEFAIVIRDAKDADEVRVLARRVIDSLSQPYRVEPHTLYVGASIGSAFGPRDGETVEELMRSADLALYRAKDEGGGEYRRFEPTLHASAEERRQLEAALRQALSRDELILHYQPVVDARSEKIVSFEALVRWNSEEHGFVSPGKFIPLAEDTRLIVPIGIWVLRQSCLEARHWPEDVKVNVNVSPEQLLEPDFPQQVIDALASSGLRPERLEIEVTESIFVRDAAVARNALEQAMALGCSVALDDFGTGYSSLGYLRKLRFSTIKVDRTFVQGASQGSNESFAIINAVVAMAKSLDMTTTAEGVESAEEAELIRNLGCDKIQGFYFGRPMSCEDARRLFHTKQRRRA
ncbi:MAG: EAL domain-containing protein [Pseudomonadota bacterium]